MKLMWEYKQKAGTITFQDFERFPIWTIEEQDDGISYEIPVRVTDPLQIDEEDLVVFVYCKICLFDGAELDGMVYIDLTNMQEYGITLVVASQEFSLFPINTRRVLNEGSPEALSDWLGKPLKVISPLTYSSPFRYPDGKRVEGEIDLLSW